jgi:hypothetical protein
MRTRTKGVRGRPKIANPKGEFLGLRVDANLVSRLDRQIEIEEQAKPGLIANRSTMVRVLINEALNAREKGKKR